MARRVSLVSPVCVSGPDTLLAAVLGSKYHFLRCFSFFGSYVFVNITIVVRYRMPGYWRRPIGRMYGYNMDLGENYYNHVLDHVDSAVDRRDRDGHTPGPLTYSERMARRFQGSDRVSEL